MSGIKVAEINMVMLSGRLTRDPELKEAKGYKICKFSIAVNKRYKSKPSGEWKDDTSYINISVWGAAATRLAEKLKKGYAVVVDGSLKSHSWENAEKKKQSSIEVVASGVQVLTKAEGAASAGDQGNGAADAEVGESGAGAGAGGDEEIPF